MVTTNQHRKAKTYNNNNKKCSSTTLYKEPEMDTRNTVSSVIICPLTQNRSETGKKTKLFVLTILIEDQLVPRGAQKYVNVAV
jgi:hypothetical protein